MLTFLVLARCYGTTWHLRSAGSCCNGVVLMITSLIFHYVPVGGLYLMHLFFVFTVVFGGLDAAPHFGLPSGCLEAVQQQLLLKPSMYWGIFPAH